MFELFTSQITALGHNKQTMEVLRRAVCRSSVCLSVRQSSCRDTYHEAENRRPFHQNNTIS